MVFRINYYIERAKNAQQSTFLKKADSSAFITIKLLIIR